MADGFWWADLGRRAKVIVDSQSGEEGIIAHILDKIGIVDRYAVEFGASDGWHLSNTRFLRELGWDGLMMDRNSRDGMVHQEWITAENINDLFAKYHVPPSVDVLSIDIDGMDYWVWNAIDEKRFEARVVVIEFNGGLPASPAITARYDPDFKFNDTIFYGASLDAFRTLGKAKGYTLLHQHKAVNLFFVLTRLLPEGVEITIPFKPVRNFPDFAGVDWVEVS